VRRSSSLSRCSCLRTWICWAGCYGFCGGFTIVIVSFTLNVVQPARATRASPPLGTGVTNLGTCSWARPLLACGSAVGLPVGSDLVAVLIAGRLSCDDPRMPGTDLPQKHQNGPLMVHLVDMLGDPYYGAHPGDVLPTHDQQARDQSTRIAGATLFRLSAYIAGCPGVVQVVFGSRN
jgi:hypothetical protein